MAADYAIYLGTYTRGESEGIYVADWDAQQGILSNVRLAAKADNPSFLAAHPSHPFLYAVSEKDGEGTVVAFAINDDGALQRLNSESSRGAGPCHIIVDPDGANVLAANYGAGSVVVLPIRDDGRLRPASQVYQHTGSSAHPERQKGPHAHSVYVSPDRQFALAADLGIDQILSYRFDATRGTLSINLGGGARLPPGSGPRHMAFHPDGKWVYSINELSNDVTAFRYDAKSGRLATIQTISTLPEGDDSKNSTAEIWVHPSGKFLYGSNRGHDSIACFAIDEKSGELTTIDHHPGGVKNPRSFVIDPAGEFLLAAGQDSDNIAVHRIDQQSGRLASTDIVVGAPSPVCIEFVPKRE